jgi:hypothetical protein
MRRENPTLDDVLQPVPVNGDAETGEEEAEQA